MQTVHWPAITTFYGTALALSCLLSVPVWFLGGGLMHPLSRVLITGAMFTPTMGVLVTWWRYPSLLRPIIQTTGLGLGRWPRMLWYGLLAWFGMPVLVFSALLIGSME